MRHQADPYLYANPLIEPVSLDVLAWPDATGEGEPFWILDTAPNAEDRLELVQAWLIVHNFIGTLDVRDQYLIQRIFWNGERQADVAREFAVSDAAISKRMSRIAARGRTALASLRGSELLK
jgi:DNA-directed RNA polymerase specialized sigma24 family protein